MLSDGDVDRIGRALASELRERREKLSLSKNALAQSAGVSVQSVSFIEDAVNSPSVSTLLRLCHALEVKPEEVIRAATERA